MTISAIRPSSFPWFRYEDYTFSLGLTDGENAWLSGHSASEFDPETRRMVVHGGMTAQARTAYAKIAAILEAADLQWSDVTKVTENVTVAGIEHYDEAQAVRQEIFGDHDPVLATVVVDSLLRKTAFIEVEIHASRGGGTVLHAGGTGWDRRTVREGHAGEVLLPTMLPVDDKGEVVAPKIRMERLGGAGIYPGAGGILMSRLHTPEILVAMDVTANRLPLTQVNPGWSRYDTLSYAPGVRAGDTLYMSGFAALDMETQQALHPGDVVAQAEVTYAAILETVAAAGGRPENLTSTIEFVCPEGLADYRGVAKVRDRVLRAPFPASTGAICAGLLRPEFLLEVFPQAILGESAP